MSVTVLESTQLDDRSPNITYAGAEWTVHTEVQSIFHLYNNSDTFTDRQGATATLTFYGNAVEYWGNQGPYHGPCDVSVDGSFCATVNSHADVDDDPKLLWSSSWTNGRTLDLGMHTLEVKVKNPSYPNVCEIDRFVVNITRSSGGGSDGGGSATIGQTNNGGSGGSGGTGGSNDTKKGPPIAAIAGAVGGAAVLALLLFAWWFFARRRKHKEKIAKAINDVDEKETPAPIPFSNPHGEPSPRTEKSGFGPGGGRPADRTSVGLGTPVSTPPPSTVSYNQHYQAAGFDARATSPPASTVSGQYLNTHGSPQPVQRPMSIVSSTSGAPTVSYYSSGPLTGDTTNYPMPGFVPPQHQQFASQPPQMPTQHDFQQQSYMGDAQNPVWAIPLGTQQQGRPISPPAPSQPNPAMNPVDPAAHDAGFSAYPTEKAQYRSTAAYPPEKARYGGPALSSTSGAGGSGSHVASGSGSGPSTSAPTNNMQDIMNPAISEAPPPAYT